MIDMATKAKAKANTVESVVEAGKVQMEQAVKASTEAATKNFEKGFEFTKKQVDEAVKGFDEIASFSKDNVEAVIASGNAVAKGVEMWNAEVVNAGRKAVEDSVAAFKALSGAKNLREVFDIQNALFKDGFDNFVAEAGRFSELAMKTAGEAVEPVNARVAVAVERVSQTVAR